MNKTVKIILGIVIILAVVGGSFYGGTVYGKSQAQSQVQFAPAGSQAGFARGQGGFTGRQSNAQGSSTGTQSSLLIGTIKSVSAEGLVVTDRSNNEITIKVAGTTLISKYMNVKITDLAEGETVMISGTKAEDGSYTARSLQVAPAGRFNAEGGAAPLPAGAQRQGGDFSGSGGGAPPPER